MEENFAINLVDAKNEYTKELINNLYLNMYEGIKSIYEDAKILHQTEETRSVLNHFQELLCLIPKWDSEIIHTEVQRIKENSKCDWIEDLLTAVFVSHTKILTSIRRNNDIQKINIKVPKLEILFTNVILTLQDFFIKILIYLMKIFQE